MTHEFDRDYWQRQWKAGPDGSPGSMADNPPNPYLERELAGLVPGTALDAGCGAGAEAIWLAESGWQVTAADISAEALGRAAEKAAASGAGERIEWVEADLGTWQPRDQFDLVTTHYAHPAMPQLAFYDRIATWVAPGGTLLVVGHRLAAGQPGHGHGHDQGHGHGHGHGHGNAATTETEHAPPVEASVTAATVAARLDPTVWDVATADEPHRTMGRPGGHEVTVDDVVVRATRREASA